jgi:uncharacterized protein YbcI
MKKIYIVSIFVVILSLVLGPGFSVLAQRPAVDTAQPQLTAEQQKCVNDARVKSEAIKAANEAFNIAIKDALKAKQDAMKAAIDAFNNGAKDATEVKNIAIKAAQDAFNKAIATAVQTRKTAIENITNIQDKAEREKAMQKIVSDYENDSAVKKARPIYEAAMKAANDKFNNNEIVKKIKPEYEAAVKTLNDTYENNSIVKQANEQLKQKIQSEQSKIVKKCTKISFGQRIKSFFGNMFGRNK